MELGVTTPVATLEFLLFKVSRLLYYNFVYDESKCLLQVRGCFVCAEMRFDFPIL